MKSADEMDVEELRDHVRKFQRLLNPVWMQCAYHALGDQPKPEPHSIMFHFMGGGGSDQSTYAEFEEVMGDAWAAASEAP